MPLLAVDSLPELAGAFERNDFPGFEDQILACGRIATPAFFLFPDAKFPEAADQDILSGFQGHFDDFQGRFNDLGRPAFGKLELILNVSDNLRFGQCHGAPPAVELQESDRLAFFARNHTFCQEINKLGS
jgi:hypothetical protein